MVNPLLLNHHQVYHWNLMIYHLIKNMGGFLYVSWHFCQHRSTCYFEKCMLRRDLNISCFGTWCGHTVLNCIVFSEERLYAQIVSPRQPSQCELVNFFPLKYHLLNQIRNHLFVPKVKQKTESTSKSHLLERNQDPSQGTLTADQATITNPYLCQWGFISLTPLAHMIKELHGNV